MDNKQAIVLNKLEGLQNCSPNCLEFIISPITLHSFEKKNCPPLYEYVENNST